MGVVALWCVLALLPLPVTAAQALQQQLDALLDGHPAAHRTHIALKVEDLDSGAVLYDRDGEKLFTPASNLKIYTSACALEQLGADHRFTTTIGSRGKAIKGILIGDLILSGGGDPYLKSDDLRAMVKQLCAEQKLSRVRGDIIVDESLFASRRKGPGWMWDDDPDPYNMSIASIMLDYNTLTATVYPETSGGKARIELTPPTDFPPIGPWTNFSGKLNVSRQPFEDVITASGPPTSGDGPTTFSLTMHNSSMWIGSVFEKMLEDEGVHVSGRVRVESQQAPFVPLLRHESAPLSEIVHRLNKVSENAIGEMLIHDIAVKNNRTPATWTTGAEEVTKWLTGTAGLDPGSFHLVDGSGLSRYDLISPDSSVRLLRYMHTRPTWGVYLESFPIFKVKLPASVPAGTPVERVFAKTGGMSGVSTLSGCIRTLDGRMLAFSFLTNNYIGAGEQITDLRGKIFTILVQVEGEKK